MYPSLLAFLDHNDGLGTDNGLPKVDGPVVVAKEEEDWWSLPVATSHYPYHGWFHTSRLIGLPPIRPRPACVTLSDWSRQSLQPISCHFLLTLWSPPCLVYQPAPASNQLLTKFGFSRRPQSPNTCDLGQS